MTIIKQAEESRFDTKVAVYNETNVTVFENLFKVVQHNYFLSLVLLNISYLWSNAIAVENPLVNINLLNKS